MRRKPLLFLLLSAAAISLPAHAGAGELETYLRAALQRSPAVQSARMGAQVARAQQTGARSRLLPSLGASGSYTRNERAVTVPLGGAATTQQGLTSEAPPVVITPLNQLDLNLSLDVPLFDGAAFARSAAADSGVD
ncbi:MAG TPA: TolC family protein, partial [Myxococcales bacterium]|nr:TolC family protein [Myxococcales bacterium]